MTSEDLVSSKDQEICALSEELRKLREDLETIPVLKAQMDIYHADFQAERSARERQHDEMEQLRIQLEQFRAHMSPSHEAQQLQSQSQPQPTSNASRSGRYRRSYPYPGPYDEPDDQADTLTDQLATRNLASSGADSDDVIEKSDEVSSKLTNDCPSLDMFRGLERTDISDDKHCDVIELSMMGPPSATMLPPPCDCPV
ncbi:PREDICTED: optineurin-like [Priapulus caudatus]|uniref:Optineurin-like n=1 Tax=Priapulus caudatus TaxID=37621 RepID=A0ABM1EZ13_PRICU|nr:PREDICTED: optineurin-like [Priapulus caudatus]